jgi:hypothetical protein
MRQSATGASLKSFRRLAGSLTGAAMVGFCVADWASVALLDTRTAVVAGGCEYVV